MERAGPVLPPDARAPDGYSAVPLPVDRCAPVVLLDDSLVDAPVPPVVLADYYSAAPQAAGYFAPVVPRGGSVVGVPAQLGSAEADDYFAVAPPDGFVPRAARDDCCPGDCSAEPVDSSVRPADDSLPPEPEQPDSDSALADSDQAGLQLADSAPADSPGDSPSDYQAQVVPVAQHSAGRQDGP